jgi:hypothetical protein
MTLSASFDRVHTIARGWRRYALVNGNVLLYPPPHNPTA